MYHRSIDRSINTRYQVFKATLLVLLHFTQAPAFA
jgi:hypothetical protein